MSTVDSLEASFQQLIAQEVGCRPQQIAAASQLFADGSTVPFVARYRKEATGGLDDEVLETVHKRRDYFLELASRRDAILESISEQGKLTPELEKLIRAATSKQFLEDLYLPYKKKRRTRAQIAREKGLEPLADALLQSAAAQGEPENLATSFVDSEKEVADADAALAGARDILAERLAESADERSRLRKTMQNESLFKVRVLSGKEDEGKVYKDYFDYHEPSSKIPSHRLLAVLRGEREGFLLTDLSIDDDAEVARLARSWDVPLSTPCGRQVEMASADGYKRLLRPSITNEVRGSLRERADEEAIRVFRANLEALLLQSPYGQVPVMGLDPGYRTGCKLAVVDGTGRVLATDVIYPIEPKARAADAASKISSLVKAHDIRAIAIGNGTGSRETELFARRTVKDAQLGGGEGESVIVAIVPETGASVYSASATAREELPDMDVSLRGAVSIARRLQDPLAELVKIDPKSLGVGQYQHDVNQKALADELDSTVESAVNRVGVELNSASAALLRRVSGVSDRIAQKIVEHRDTNGRFTSRKTLLKVAGFGPKTYEQAAGFLRIRDGEHPLDRTAVHPERYGVVEKMARAAGVGVVDLVGNPQLVAKVNFDQFADADAGLGRFTLEDIRTELERPGRDPRPNFEIPKWRDEITTIDDLQPGMELEGRVSNVTNFGAFVDLGVKRDGLVHLSELANRWVEDPREVVQVGQVVKVKVMEVDRERGRIGLSMKALQAGGGGEAAPPPRKSKKGGGGPSGGSNRKGGKSKAAPSLSDLAAKFNRR